MLRQFVTGSLVAALFMAVPVSANVVGTDIQNFNPTTGGLDFVTVHSSETLEPGVVNVGFFLNYAVNTMPNYENTTSQSRTDFEDSLLGGDINVGVGLAKNWDIGFSFPQVYAQDSDDTSDVYQGEVSQTGLTEYRLNTKYRFFGDERGGLAAIVSANFDRVKNNPFVGKNSGPTLNAELAWDTTTAGNVVYGFNAGYRKRDSGSKIEDVPVQPFQDQFIASAAVSYRLERHDLKLIGEVFGSFPTEEPDNTTDRDMSSIELLVGVKKDIRHDVALHAGGGTELYHGSSSPDWRVYTGVNWNFGPLWRKKTPEQTPAEPKRLEELDSEFFASTPVTPTEKFVAGDVLFEFNSAELAPAFQETLNKFAAYLKSGAGFKSLVVGGHTDSVGAEEYNLNLSQRRAESVRAHLVSVGGLAADAVKAVGYGETMPIADNANFQGRQRNRRVEFNISR